MLLSLLGLEYKSLPAAVDEAVLAGESPVGYVVRLATAKSLAVSRLVSPQDVVIGADTAVVDGSDVLGKPVDAAQAEAMLERLRGRAHLVYTGLSVLSGDGKKMLSDWCVTQVIMRDYSPSEIRAYIMSGDPLDKAGAYAIQHASFDPVERITGCYANVVGLPLCHLADLFREIGLAPANDVTANCRTGTGYACQLAETILKNA
jgi:MAF protein